jgi:NTE family protein
MLNFGQSLFRNNSEVITGPPLTPAPAPSGSRPKIGLALGAGSARGWCHIGVLRELKALGIVPDVIVGTSIGAVVGGCYAAGRLDDLEEFARGLTRTRVFTMLDWSFSGRGLISGGRLRSRLEVGLAGVRIEDLPIRFAAVATESGSGHEVWLTRGPLERFTDF